jgi:pimeloyl-ACP methyl ester carboxylesterase
MRAGSRFIAGVPVRQCAVVCADGIELMGLVLDPGRSSSRRGAILFVHGQFDNAYQPRLNQRLLEECARADLACVVANTRGQDLYSEQRTYPPAGSAFGTDDYGWVLLGSSQELVAEAGVDLDAWIGFVIETFQVPQVFLAGHSHGAIKAANYALDSADDAVSTLAGIALLSPSDDIGSRRAALGERYSEALELARALVEQGRETDLMPTWAYWAPLSARTYLEGFGAGSPLRTFALHEPETSPLASGGGWPVPTLVVYGEADGATAGMSSDAACRLIHSWLTRAPAVTSVVVAGADHTYKGHEAGVARAICEWAVATGRRSTAPAPPGLRDGRLASEMP